MKICIDMQGLQTGSRHRGIGRYCLEITRAFLDIATPRHATDLLYNAALDGIDEAIGSLGANGRRASRRTVGPIRDTSFDNIGNDARREAAERLFGHALQVKRPDVVWHSSIVEGFADDALVPYDAPGAMTVATLYDLIPLHDPEYLGHARARDWYMNRLNVLRRCDLLLAISEWVRTDAIERLGIDPGRIVTVGAGVAEKFRPRPDGQDQSIYLREHFAISRPFVMYNGGFDKRKNITSLIEAYGSLGHDLRASHVLVIVGRMDKLAGDKIAEAMATLRLTADDVVFTGFVSDDDLIRLYQSCTLFVFPSEREGFGLAPLEAMACGAPALVNNATSLPEVVGTAEALFDADEPGALRARMEATLRDDTLLDRLRASGMERARHFTWQAVASRALSAIENALSMHPDRHTAPARNLQSVVPLYRVDATSVETVLQQVRQWPGVVAWSGPLPGNAPMLPADRYRLHGYGDRVPALPADWLALLEQAAAGVIIVDESTPVDVEDRANMLRATHPMARQRSLEADLSASVAHALADDDLARVADALDRLRPTDQVRWLVDVTHISTTDLGTGVHRVVRSILLEWLICPPPGVRIEPITFRDGRFHHAHMYACALLGSPDADALPGELVSITGSEVYIGLDWTMESLPSSAPLIRTWHRAGVRTHFVVYDLLPLTMPEAFHAQSRESFARWVAAIASEGDALHCISESTRTDVIAWLATAEPGDRPLVTRFELGVSPAVPVEPALMDAALSSAMDAAPSFLMVGTIEPRKGHAQVIDAMELLWEAGVEANLVILGKKGWLVRQTIDSLARHPQRNKRLFWIDGADDALLEAAYQASTALVAASLGEGYGLPLVEAAHRGIPVIARDLPVFREVAGNYPSYFKGESARELATYLARWLADRPATGDRPEWISWSDSARSLQRRIDDPRDTQSREL